MTDHEHFEQFTLREIRISENELGRGSYAVVIELEYQGLKCAGKKLYRVLYEAGIGHAARRYLEECRLLSLTRHPNIVQFLGVCFEEGSQFPILVMEFLPTNLTSCLERYDILPDEINFSILHDVSLGLAYLHGQTPVIVHRDLSANNVLLSTNMTAKISDLGVARILNLTPLQVSRMTETPGTPAYMPPEVMVADPHYNTSVDVFSFGVMMIHTFTAEWPLPKVGQTRIDPVNPDGLIPVTEAERREEFLQKITPDHPLMDLIIRCLSNNPHRRPAAEEIVGRVRGVVLDHPPSIENRAEMLHRVSTLLTEKRTLEVEIERKARTIRDREEEITQLMVEKTEQQQETENSMQCIELAHSFHTSGLQLQIDQLNKEQETAQIAVRTKDTIVAELELQCTVLGEEIEQQIANCNLAHKKLDTKELEYAKLEIENATLASQVTTLALQVEQERLRTQTKEVALSVKHSVISSMASTIATKTSCIRGKEDAIASLNSQLRSTRNFLTKKQQIMQASISHGVCSEALMDMAIGQAVAINGKVYYGGGFCDNTDNEFFVQCYESSKNIWSVLPNPAIHRFGMGEIAGKLVLVGGVYRDFSLSATLHAFDEHSHRWMKTIPPMLTARSSPAVVSLPMHLVVAGGETQSHWATQLVEIYNIAAHQWNTTDELPYACTGIRGTISNNTVYLMGGDDCQSRSNRIVKAKIEDLISNSKPSRAQQNSDDTPPSPYAWTELQSTPNYRPSAVTTSDMVLAVGGADTANLMEVIPTRSIYAYSTPMNSWVYIGDLPAPVAFSAFVPLSQTEFLMIGGRDTDWHLQSSTYKVTFKIGIQ